MQVICVNLNFLNTVNGKAPGRSWAIGDPEVDKVYEVLDSETYNGVTYYKLENCSVLWMYESSSFEPLVSSEELQEALEFEESLV